MRRILTGIRGGFELERLAEFTGLCKIGRARWIAWKKTTAGKPSRFKRRITVEDSYGSYEVVRLPLTSEQISQFYYVTTKEALWPILNGFPSRYSAEDYDGSVFREVHRLFAAAACEEAAPGIPQMYYVGLLAGSNDHELMEATGELRDINRHVYSADEVAEAVLQPVVKRLLKLMEFRSHYPAFNGVFHLMYSNDSSVAMCWRHGELRCDLFVDLNFKKATISYVDEKSRRWLSMRV